MKFLASRIPAVLLLISCTGTIGTGNGDQSGGSGTAGPGSGAGGTLPSLQPPDPQGNVPLGNGQSCKVQVGRSPARMLTAVQYRNALVDLTGDATLATQDLPAEAAVDGFLNNADAQNPQDALVSAYEVAAEKASLSVLTNRSKTIPCTATTTDCATQFIQTFAGRAFRRPLVATEQSAFVQFFKDRQTAGADFDTALRLTTFAILQSPQFLYVPEFGQGNPSGTDQSKALTPYELASRMSLVLTNSLPDTALLASAQSGALSNADEIDRQARRLLATPRGQQAVAIFHQQWLEISRLDLPGVAKDPATFPMWNSDLKQAMRDELDQFTVQTTFNRGGHLKDLFTSTDLWVNDKLAPLYGVNAPSGSNFGRVTGGSPRAGIFTLTSTLADRGHQVQSSPVWRGIFVLDKLLCRPPGSPPKGVNTTIDDTPHAANTGRQRESAHVTTPSCAACHTSIDGAGFGFENYDAIGRYRTTDNGSPVDATGTVTTSAGTLKFNGAVDLANQLSSDPDVHSCITTQWFRSSFARLESDADSCTIQSIDTAFHDGGDDLQGLLVSVMKSYAFNRVAVSN